MDLDLGLECPECGAAVKATLQDVARQRTVRCSRGHSIALEDEGGGARRAQSSLDGLDRALNRLGR